MSEILFPNEMIVETKFFDVHQDWEIPIPGFFIIAPKRKLRTIDEFTNEEAVEYINLVRDVRRGMNEILNINDVYFFQNEDTRHNFHLWVFPRHDWMEEFGRKIESVKPIMNYAKEKMLDEGSFEMVRLYVEKMKIFFETGKFNTPH